VVAPTSDKNHFEVIDGQQRLTTFFLILCALRQLFKGEAQEKTISNLVTTDYTGTDGETRVSLKLSPRYENADEFVSKLVEINSDPATVRNGIRNAAITSFGSLENLLDVYATIHRYLREAYGDIKELKKFWGYLAK
jgi:Protein of unknown function DUF262